MHRLALATALTAALAFGIPTTPALAWNNHGHMLIAAVAWRDLTPASRQRVGKLLRRNPMYGQWTAGVPKRERARVAFMKAATWPDLIRNAPGYVRDDIATSGASASQNIGYDDHLVHPYWHFKDLPFSPDGTATAPFDVPNAQTQISAFRLALRGPASDDVKAYDLAWLEHLVGDVHQPLHATSRFTHDAPGGDRGGNSVKLCPQTDCRDNLHSFWDGALGREEDPQAVTAEAAALISVPAELASITDENTWLEESLVIAGNSVYAPPIGPTTGPYVVTPQYQAVAGQVARGRAALAGARLARLINENLR